MNGQKRARVKRGIPNGFTLANGICGFSAIVVAATVQHPSAVLFSAGLIILAMIFDGLDGRVARMTGVTSNLGANLDSLCDAVSFGLAPAFLFYSLLHNQVPLALLWIAGALYVGCAIFRLARFNVETTDQSEDGHLWFNGLPSTMAALVVVISTLTFSLVASGKIVAFAIVAATAASALLMVSHIRFPHVNLIIRLIRARK
ncbi:MAG TPA: CDP-diacylglycerol--serine O-phosphatidyltransferase [Candidatus Obscuribacterales bacterium]